MAGYKDIRQEFWRETFEAALPFDAYLGQADPTYRSKWEDMAGKITVPDAALVTVKQFVRKMPVLVYSGVWCGDCVRQGPMFQKLVEANPCIDLRFSERDDDSKLADELRINGALKVPVVVFLSEDFYELGRFGDRLLTVYRRMARTQLGAACDTGLIAPPQSELQAEINEWVDVFERMHIILRLAPLLRKRYND